MMADAKSLPLTDILVVGIAAAGAPAVAAIAAISAALLLVWKYWDRISSFVSGFASGVMGALSPVTTAISSLAGGLLDLLGIDLSPVAAMFGRIGEAIGAALAIVRNFFGSLFSAENLSDAEKAEMAAASERPSAASPSRQCG